MIKEGNRDIIRVELGAERISTRISRLMLSDKFARGVRVQHIRIPKSEIPALAVEFTSLFAQAKKGILMSAPSYGHKMIIEPCIGPRKSLFVGTGLKDHAAI